MSRYSLGAAAITFGLPLLLFLFAFGCNDVAGCPIPSLLPSRPFTWANVKADTGLLNLSLSNFISWEAIFITVAYYAYGLCLWRILPAKEVYGTKLVHHGRPLLYRFNGMYTSPITSSSEHRCGLRINYYPSILCKCGDFGHLCCGNLPERCSLRSLDLYYRPLCAAFNR